MFGIIGMVVAGILEFAVQPGSPWLEMLAFVFGCGAALTLDEFALVLHLEDVYWTGEGRKSIDAIILGVTFITLLLTGLLPRTFSELGDYITVSRWVALRAHPERRDLRGRLLPQGQALRRHRRASSCRRWRSWARSVSPSRGRRGRAGGTRDEPRQDGARRRRDEGFHQKWERRKHRLWDVIGGKPHLSLPHRDGITTATTAVRGARRLARVARQPRRSARVRLARRPRYHEGMDGSPQKAPPRGRHPMLDEALDLVDAARADGVEARLVGGLAVLALCADQRRCRRDHRDLDLVAPRPAAKRLLATFARLGYEENRHVRLASGGALLQVYRPCAHPGPAGPLHADDRVDVYLDAFRQHHTVPLRRRLRREPYTVPPSDVLLAKLLRTQPERDRRRGRRHAAAGTSGRRTTRRRAPSGGATWRASAPVTGGSTTTSRATSRASPAEADALGLGDDEAARVRAAAAAIGAALAAARKGPRWRLRARIGERLPWYDAVDEDDGQRIGLRERPACPAGAAASGGRA